MKLDPISKSIRNLIIQGQKKQDDKMIIRLDIFF